MGRTKNMKQKESENKSDLQVLRYISKNAPPICIVASLANLLAICIYYIAKDYIKIPRWADGLPLIMTAISLVIMLVCVILYIKWEKE